MQTITSSGTRTALTWLAFLLILWLQSIEPKLKDADRIQLGKHDIGNTLSGFANVPLVPSNARIYADFNTRIGSLGGEVQKSREEPIDLPFGIKIKSIPSTYVPLLWNLLFIGLLIYLLSVRRRATELAAQSVRLLQYAAKVPEEQLYDVSAGASWWIAPLPSGKGYEVLGNDLRRTLGWSRRWKTSLATVIGIFLVATAVDARIIYAQFRIVNTIVEPRDKPNRHGVRPSHSDTSSYRGAVLS